MTTLRSRNLWYATPLVACIMGCAAVKAVPVHPLPCPSSPPDTRRATNETNARARSITIPPKQRSVREELTATVYFIIEPSGSVSPDSIMVCGIDRPDLIQDVAQSAASARFVPVTRDGRPVRAWYAMNILFGDKRGRED